MSNKVFIVLVVFLVILIVASFVGLVLSVFRYEKVANPTDKPAVLTETQNVEETETEQPTTQIQFKDVENNNPNNSSSNDDYILPSDTKVIEASDLEGMDYETLNRAYNEIFARHGHDFKTASLKEYFSKQSWYKAIPDKTVATSELSNIENKNLNTIKARIDEIKQ